MHDLFNQSTHTPEIRLSINTQALRGVLWLEKTPDRLTWWECCLIFSLNFILSHRGNQFPQTCKFWVVASSPCRLHFFVSALEEKPSNCNKSVMMTATQVSPAVFINSHSQYCVLCSCKLMHLIHNHKCSAFPSVILPCQLSKFKAFEIFPRVSLKKFKFYMACWFKCNQTEYGCVCTTKAELLCAK